MRPVSTRLLSDNLRGAAIRHRVLQDSPEERARHQVENFSTEGSDQKLKELIETIHEKRAERAAARGEMVAAEEAPAESAEQADFSIDDEQDALNIFEPEGDEPQEEIALVETDENLTLESAMADSAEAQDAAAEQVETVAEPDSTPPQSSEEARQAAPVPADETVAVLDDDSIEAIRKESQKS